MVLQDKWKLESLLGVGGMAAVYAATHRNGKRVAVKMLHPELGHDDEVQRRFLREGYAANTVEHAGAVSVLDDDVAPDGSAFLVMELLEGETRRAALGAQRAAAAAARGARDRRPAARRARGGAREEHRPPRHQAGEPLPHARRARSRCSTSASRACFEAQQARRDLDARRAW